MIVFQESAVTASVNFAACSPQMPRISQPQTVHFFVALQLSGFCRRCTPVITFNHFWVLLPAFQLLLGSTKPRRGSRTPEVILLGSHSTPTVMPPPSLFHVARPCSYPPFRKAELERGWCNSPSEMILLFPLLNKVTSKHPAWPWLLLLAPHYPADLLQQLSHTPRCSCWHSGPAANWATSHLVGFSSCNITSAGCRHLTVGQVACGHHSAFPSTWKTLPLPMYSSAFSSALVSHAPLFTCTFPSCSYYDYAGCNTLKDLFSLLHKYLNLSLTT